jgi:hypothetical protein
MLCFSPRLQEILWVLAPAFTTPTFQNLLVLFVGAVMSPRDRTVAGMLRAAGFLATKQFSTYHRVLSHRKWDVLLLAGLLASIVIALIPPDTPVICIVDDTVVRRWGKHVYGKGCHRDPVRSTRKKVVHCLGPLYGTFLSSCHRVFHRILHLLNDILGISSILCFLSKRGRITGEIGT